MSDSTAPPSGTAARGGWPHELDDEYEFRGELGRGGMAVVYRAREKSLGREVAIKIVRPRFTSDEESVARLAREARTVAQLEHPNIVSLHAVKRLTNGLALVMQLVPGRTLKAALAAGPLPPDEAAHILRDIARALAYAHRASVVHRDVKPENIFLDEITGRALLSDFGVARSIEENSELTATGTAIGTPTYMSPEQIDGGHLDGRSDLYSLGMVGWEMLTGQRPWAGESLYSVIYRQKHDPLPPLDALRPDVPPPLQYLIEGLMHKNPERRWASAARFLTLLASDAPAPGFKEWQALARKRRKSNSGGVASVRARGAITPAAAPSTVRFRRGEDEPSPPLASPDDLQALAIQDANDTQRLATSPTGVAAIHDDGWRESPRRRLPIVLAGSALAVAAALALVFLLPDRGSEGATVSPSVTAFSDERATEVPVLPRAESIAVAGALPSDSSPPPDRAAGAVDTGRRALSPPPGVTARALDSLRAVAAARLAAPEEPPAARSRSASVASPPPPVVAAVTAAPVVPVPVARPGADSSAAARDSGAATSRTVGTPVVFPAERGTIAAGGRHTCMLDAAGRARCWGNNERGQLGDGTYEGRPTPHPTAGELVFSSLSAGGWHTCGVARDGDLLCWGSNDAGQLGDGTTIPRSAPVRVTGSATYRLVRAGQSHSCALSRGGSVLCWGSNARGQVGDGSRATRTAPATVSLGGGAGAVTVGRAHSCALAIDGTAHCWGDNSAGQLGDGTTTDRTTPTPVSGERRYVSIAAGLQHTCAVSTESRIWCWGKNTFGQLGTGATADVVPTPQGVEASADFVTVTAGQVHSCGRARDGRVWCWGRNIHGQLGDGTTADRVRPVAVRGGIPFATLNASGAHTCGTTAAGEGMCWGYNIDGQLGGGDRENATAPARVSIVPR